MKLKELDGLYLKNKDLATKSFFTLIAPITPPVIIQDYDGNIYTSVRIGNQEWMVENLIVTHYRDGTEIPNVINDITWNGLSSGAYCWYNNDAITYADYGVLYNAYAVQNSKGLAPIGWRIPTYNDFVNLCTYLGGYPIAGGKMKEEGLVHWTNPNTGATNESGFTGLSTGIRYWAGGFDFINELGDYYSSSWYELPDAPYHLTLNYDNTVASLSIILSHPEWGLAVRCMRDV